MSDIKPAEVSAILKKQIEGFKSEVELEEVGTVLEVGDGIARIYGLSNVQSNEMIEFENSVQGIVLNLEEDNVGAVLLGSSELVKEGSTVRRTQRIASINVGEGLLGRVINTLGKPIDGKGAISGVTYEMPLERKAPGVIFRQPVKEPLQTGIKAIDAMIPIGRGQRELIIGDRQTGKTAIAIDTILNQKEFYEKGQTVYCIYVAIGQKGSTIANIANTLERFGATPYTVIVAATASDPAALQFYLPCCLCQKKKRKRERERERERKYAIFRYCQYFLAYSNMNQINCLAPFIKLFLIQNCINGNSCNLLNCHLFISSRCPLRM